MKGRRALETATQLHRQIGKINPILAFHNIRDLKSVTITDRGTISQGIDTTNSQKASCLDFKTPFSVKEDEYVKDQTAH